MNNIEVDDIVIINGQPFRVEKVSSVTSLDLKPLGWWARVLWRIRCLWRRIRSMVLI